MNCEYCHVESRKFYCANCINGKLRKHKIVMKEATLEKGLIVEQATAFLERATVIQNLIASKNKLCMSLDSIQTQQNKIIRDIQTKSLRISELKRSIETKRKIVEQAQSRFKKCADLKEKNEAVIKAWQRTHKMTIGTRRVLVQEVVSLFELKQGVVEEKSLFLDQEDKMPFSKKPPNVLNKEDLYICGVTLPTKLIDVSTCPKEEINAPISLVVHILRLIVHYLGIKLPFKIFQKGINPYIQLETLNPKLWKNNNKMPLFLDKEDKNFKRFTIGVAMLNYNIAYLCYTQGIEIPLSEVANTLQSLMSCCHSPKLGIKSHANIYKGIRNLEFPVEFDQVWKITALRYKTQPDRLESIYDGSQFPPDHLLLYPDSEEEIEDEKKLDKIEPSSIEQSDHWNLVDVVPSFHRGANNGNEGENMFQQAATNFMPGVMSVVESLNQHDRSSILGKGRRYLR